jgi:Fe-S-cluster containining protein
MSASCALCGVCCEEIYIGKDHATIMGYPLEEPPAGYAARDPEHEEVWKVWDTYLTDGMRDALFFRVHWHPIMNGEVQRSRDVGHGPRYAYTCDAYDRERRICTAHDTRPTTCRGYPWYGRPPVTDAIEHPRCSYWHDVPREQWPTWVDPLPSPESD